MCTAYLLHLLSGWQLFAHPLPSVSHMSFQTKLFGRSLPSVVNSAVTFTYTLWFSNAIISHSNYLLSLLTQNTHEDEPYDLLLHHRPTKFCHGT